MDFNDSITYIREFLEEKIADPISKRATSWIWEDDTRIDLDKSPYPKMLLRATESDLTKERLGLGQTSTIDTYELSIEIKAKLGEHYGLGADKFTGRQFVQYLGAQVESQIKSNNDTFVELGFIHVIPTKSRPSKDNENNPIFTLKVEVKFQN